MDAARWRRVEAAFDRLADLPPDDQAAGLDACCGDDDVLRAEVERLLVHDRSRGAALAATLKQMAALPVPAAGADLVGRRLGAYRLVREIGRGGMGVVFEAVRDDDQYQKRVAIKLAGHAAWSAHALRRFRDERQILARLDHPGIARLLDGGTTDEGVPYFAMDYVDGEPIHEYAESHQLAVRERLLLFLQVCDAVEYAHQNLVVHCDLKPRNILVAAGAVRLLDFGIARLLDAGDLARAATGIVPVTPDYGSPEQVRGEPVTTRTDVHALGLVLFELLTGARALQADTRSAVTLVHSVCEVPLDLPSVRLREAHPARARAVAGDLDTIVLTAAHKDTTRRYPSVAALADDIRRHLERRPVRARQDSAWYRGRRYARRHWLPLTAAALVASSLAGGVLAARYQARRAERRFEQVRSLANALMGEVHGAVRDLPASTAAQDVLVRTAVQYLDGLVPESQGDRALQIDLVRGYLKVAEVSYSLSRPSLGRIDDSRLAFDKAAALLGPLEAGDADADVAVLSLAYRTQHAGFLLDTETAERAAAVLDEAIDRGEAALRRWPAHPELLRAQRDALQEFTSKLGGHPAAGARVERAIAVAETLLALDRRSPDAIAGLAVAYSQAANVASNAGDPAKATAWYRAAIDMQGQLLALQPDNATVRRNLMIAWSNVADVALGPLGNSSYTGAGGPPMPLPASARAEAREAFDHALDQARWLFEHDAANATVRFDYAVCLGRSAPSFPEGDARAVQVLDESLAIMTALAADNPTRGAAFLIEFHGSLAERHRQMQRLDVAIAHWRQVDAVLRQALARDPDGYYPRRLAIPVFENWAQALAGAGRRAEARAVAARALALADEVGVREAQYRRAAGWPPRTRDWLARLHDQLGDAAAARRARDESAQQWRALAARADLPSDLRDEARSAAP